MMPERRLRQPIQFRNVTTGRPRYEVHIDDRYVGNVTWSTGKRTCVFITNPEFHDTDTLYLPETLLAIASFCAERNREVAL